jgi:membrane protein implicated in regulation of membrane protease activity
MIALYVFAAIVGLPLVAYAALSGDDGDADGSHFEDGGIFSYFSIGTVSFFTGFFGLTGLATSAVGADTLVGLVLSVVVGLIAATAHRKLLLFVAEGSASSHLSDLDFSGKAATVVVPIGQDQRGRILIQAGGERHQLTAELAEGRADTIKVGDSVVVLSVEGGVARVSSLDPELG